MAKTKTRARPSSTGRRAIPQHRTRLVAAVVVALAVYYAMALNGIRHDSGTFDEYADVTAGYSYWAFNDYRLNPEAGNWTQRLLALPHVLHNEPFPSLAQPAWQRSDIWALSDQFFFAQGRDADALLHRSRAIAALFGALLGALIFCWSRRLFGTAGGWISLLLFVFSPTMLANGGLATSDLMTAACFTAAVWALWSALHRLTPSVLALSCLATAATFLAKPSGPLLLPVAAVMIGLRMIGGRPWSMRFGSRSIALDTRAARWWAVAGIVLVHLVVTWLLIWASFGFRYEAFNTALTGRDAFIDPWDGLLASGSVIGRIVAWGREQQILPEAYLYGMSNIVAYSTRLSFLNGNAELGGSRWFYPYAVLVKTTIPALLLIALGPMMLLWRRRARRDAGEVPSLWGGLYDVSPLLALVVIYSIVAVMSSLNIGIRYLLPIMPATIILSGAAGQAFSWLRTSKGVSAAPRRFGLPAVPLPSSRRSAIAAAAVSVLLLWHIVESVRIGPHYLAYFNALDGGPRRAYEHLVDSSLDWGQDLPGLKRWLDTDRREHLGRAPVYLSYFGTALPQYYGIDAQRLPGFPDRGTDDALRPLTAGVYCISATMLQGMYLIASGRWTAEYESYYQTLNREFDPAHFTVADRDQNRSEDERLRVRRSQRALGHLRFARLAASLRKRAPDANAGYSILIYRVSEAELARALFGPVP